MQRLREALQGAGRGEVDPAVLASSTRDLWRDHEPALRAAAGALTEEMRRQALGELYKWRDQLRAQLATPQTAARRDTTSQPGSANEQRSD